MHHAAAQHFQPAGLLADTAAGAIAHHALDIDFRRWLREREVGRPEANLQLLLEEHAQEILDHALEVGKADIFVNQ